MSTHLPFSVGRHLYSRTSRSRALRFGLVACLGIAGFLLARTAASQAPSASAPARGAQATAASAPRPEANLAQMMRGILYTSSNVIYAAQGDITPPPDASPTSPNPLTSAYGGWEAVENAGLALNEAANLIVLPGRVCSNGKPAPVQSADWLRFTQGLREAGIAVYKAAQSKSEDAILEAADVMTVACANCHNVYREKENLADRCTLLNIPTIP